MSLSQMSPHSLTCVTSSHWDRPYSREVAAFPLVSSPLKLDVPAGPRSCVYEGPLPTLWGSHSCCLLTIVTTCRTPLQNNAEHRNWLSELLRSESECHPGAWESSGCTVQEDQMGVPVKWIDVFYHHPTERWPQMQSFSPLILR